MERAGFGGLVIALLAVGCVDAVDTATVPDRSALLAPSTDAALFHDPQHFPHPAYGWATLTHVPPHAPALWQPIAPRAVPLDVVGFEELADFDGDSGAGDGIAVFGRIAVNPGGAGTPVEIVDLTDPLAPVLLSSFDTGMTTRSASIVAYPDGRLVVVLVAEAPFLLLYDVTDAAAPEPLATIELPSGAHNVGVVPGTPILYNANSVGTLVNPLFYLNGGNQIVQTEIYDLSDPEAPVLVQEWQNGLGCHAISFFVDGPSEKMRAYCPGVDEVQIWDIADPLAPEVITTFPFWHARAPLPGSAALSSVAHTAIVNRDASVLAVSDETFGGGQAYCDGATGPLGNVWFYDIKDETSPKLLGWTGVDPTLPQDAFRWCLGHVGRMVPHAERDLLALSFYGGGVALIDFTDPAAPWIADQWQGHASADVWYTQGWLVSGDRHGGFAVLGLR